jgi:exopolysaccharide biosynthesis protein
LRQPGISFLVTPPSSEDDLPLRARTTSRFLEEFNLQVAINGSGFSPWRSNTLLDYYPHTGDPIGPIGLAASRGDVYSQAVQSAPILYISRTNQARFNVPIGRVYNALSGNAMLLEQGRILPEPGGDLQPRSAVGLDKSGRTLILVVVDGRQSGYSEGVTLAELAEILLENGAYTAMNLDGGGSSTLVSSTRGGQAEILNSPIDQRLPGRERPVGNHLGIYAGPISDR